MTKKLKTPKNERLLLDFGEVSDKQLQFLCAKSFYVCYGGARGGGKSHILRLKAVGMCLRYPGLRVLMIRAHYPELEENLIRPILRWLPQELCTYNGSSRLLQLSNGSEIKFGHYNSDDAENEYQGVQFDVIFIDEATQLSERAFRFLSSCVRGVNAFPKRMYLSCNPGGVGHTWVKRLFIDRDFRVDPADPEGSERAEDYSFIPARVDDNRWLLASSPGYLRQLAALPEDLRRAHRYGDWDALGGNYFKEFGRRHRQPRFPIPAHWPVYRAIDYGLDCFACGWFAVDADGRSWCFRELEIEGLIVQEAARAALRESRETALATFAPPDLWARQKDTGRSMAEIFAAEGLPLTRADNARARGHLLIKSLLAPRPLGDPFVRALYPEGQAPAALPGLMFFEDLGRIAKDLSEIQTDREDPNDCARTPHELTHSVDMLRYYCVSRTRAAESPRRRDRSEDYERSLLGGEPGEGYV